MPLVRPPLRNIQELTSAMAVADASPDQLVFDEKGTICSPKAPTISGLPLTVLTGLGPDSEILMVGELSRGGMGKVLLAEQTSIGREVAVKVAARRGEDRAADLVVEARVAGKLEHPNIVPVHILGQNAEGAPLIVMKRIEGRSFKDLLAEGPDLARDVDILMDVCRALHFAHAHGVAHRDAKPANVMVGRFGEVYLLDWGVAVGFGDCKLPDMPHVRDGVTLVGTPHYMAPEMAFSGGAIDQRTDVFLVGAMLCEIITGKPPHARANIEETLFAAHLAERPDLSGAPEELAAICTKALERDPDRRFQSAEELRAALARFQSHAASRELCDDAEKRLSSLLALPADADGVQRTFTECRFAFAHALRIWPESTRAKSGLERAITSMARRELAAGHYDSAKLLADELTGVPALLAAELDDLRAKREREAADVSKLQQFAADHDGRIAERERALFVFACGIGWLILLLTCAALDRAKIFHAGGGTFAVGMSVFASIIAALGVIFPGLKKNAASRALLASILVCAVAIGVVHAVGWWFDVGAAPLLAVGDTVLATTAATIATSDRRLWAAAVVIGLIAPAIMLLPGAAYVISGVGSFLGLALIGWSWRRGD